ncbi:MAG TPA: head GIN domain-containing protein [Thermoleophilia bacterium]|nr:head GIN domain-containing protein [Thermoleophilia bacterium]
MRPGGFHRQVLRARAPHRSLVRLLLFLVCPALLTLAAGCGGVPGIGEVTGSGTPVTGQHDYAGFSRVQVDNAFAATVTRGDTFAVSVTVDDNLVEYLRVELDGDTLRIGLDSNKRYRDVTLMAEVTMPSLRALEVTGGSTADVTGFASQDPLDLQLSGAGKADFTDMSAGDVSVDVSGAAHLSGGLEAQELNGDVSGAGQVSLEGSASRAKLEASGAGKLELKDFSVQDVDLQLSGGASAEVRVTRSLNVEASGGAHLDYYGSPTLSKMEVSGGAEVNRAGG